MSVSLFALHVWMYFSAILCVVVSEDLWGNVFFFNNDVYIPIIMPSFSNIGHCNVLVNNSGRKWATNQKDLKLPCGWIAWFWPHLQYQLKVWTYLFIHRFFCTKYEIKSIRNIYKTKQKPQTFQVLWLLNISHRTLDLGRSYNQNDSPWSSLEHVA